MANIFFDNILHAFSSLREDRKKFVEIRRVSLSIDRTRNSLRFKFSQVYASLSQMLANI